MPLAILAPRERASNESQRKGCQKPSRVMLEPASGRRKLPTVTQKPQSIAYCNDGLTSGRLPSSIRDRGALCRGSVVLTVLVSVIEVPSQPVGSEVSTPRPVAACSPAAIM